MDKTIEEKVNETKILENQIKLNQILLDLIKTLDKRINDLEKRFENAQDFITRDMDLGGIH